MSRQNRIAAILIAGAACCVVAGFVISEFNAARRAAEHSARMALFKEAELLLEEYRTQHGAFPTSLDALEFTFPDGGDDSTLKLLQYESDGKTYSLVTTDYFGKEYRQSR